MVVLCARRLYKGRAKGNSGTNRILADALTCINKARLNGAGRQQRFRWDLVDKEVKNKTE